MRHSSERASVLKRSRWLVAESLEDRRLLNGLSLLGSPLLTPLAQSSAAVAALAAVSTASAQGGLVLAADVQLDLSAVGLEADTSLSLAVERAIDLGLTATLGDEDAPLLQAEAGLKVSGEAGLALATGIAVQLGESLGLGVQLDAGLQPGEGIDLEVKTEAVLDAGITPALNLNPGISLGVPLGAGPNATAEALLEGVAGPRSGSGGNATPIAGGDLGPGPGRDPSFQDALGLTAQPGSNGAAAAAGHATSAPPAWFLLGLLGSRPAPGDGQPESADPTGPEPAADGQSSDSLAVEAAFLDASLWELADEPLGPVEVAGVPLAVTELVAAGAAAAADEGAPLETVLLPQDGTLIEPAFALDGAWLEQFLQSALEDLAQLSQEMACLLAQLGVEPWVFLALTAALAAGEVARRNLRQARQRRAARRWLPGAAGSVCLEES